MIAIIEIPDHYKNIPQDYYNLPDAVRNGKILPDSVTNGDVINALFPSYIAHGMETMHKRAGLQDWWDAPYRKEQNND